MLYLLILFGFFLLVYGGNMLVDGAASFAKKMGVSSLLIGLTLVGFGTSTPELMTSLQAALMHKEGISVGNVVGSNIANILLVLGVAAAIRGVPVDPKSFKRDGSFLILSTAVLVIALLLGRIGFFMGLAMCATLAFYVWYSYQTDKKQVAASEKTVSKRQSFTRKELVVSLMKTVGGIALTLAGAHILVVNAAILAQRLGVSETVIGLTMVALGTSLPELITSIVASLKGESALAFGNVVGSNIYNALFILGLTAVFVPVSVPSHIGLDVALMVAVTLALLLLGLRRSIPKIAGFAFIGVYVLYVGYLFYS